MNPEKKEYFKISAIDAIRGIKTPHERDLNDLGKDRISYLRKLDENDLSLICEKINGKLVNLDLGEEWAISKEFFKGVCVIILYQYYGDEFGDELEDEIQFRFSGEHVRLVSGEDLCHFSEIITNMIELIVESSFNPQVYSRTPSHMLKIAIKERTSPFFMIGRDHYRKMADFIKGDYLEEGLFKFKSEPLPNLTIILKSLQDSLLEFEINGELVGKLSVYDSERLVMMTVNHILRYIKLNINEKAPLICNKMFSGYYKDKFPEKFD